MSLVIAAISKDRKRISACSDSRWVNSEDNSVVYDNISKIKKKNNYTLIGVAGDLNKMKPLYNHLQKEFPNFYDWDVNKVRDESYKFLKENQSDTIGEMHFLIAGFDENKEPHLYTIVNRNGNTWKANLSSARSVYIGDLTCGFKLDKNEEDFDVVIKSMKNCIIECSKVNPAVNFEITQLNLRLE